MNEEVIAIKVGTWKDRILIEFFEDDSVILNQEIAQNLLIDLKQKLLELMKEVEGGIEDEKKS
ncbi:MAG: hypothetical protein KKF56_05660 [Nanoarchaeota archaeon]|nr:hypothetical protein [Nanoarchaeota archaeon]